MEDQKNPNRSQSNQKSTHNSGNAGHSGSAQHTGSAHHSSSHRSSRRAQILRKRRMQRRLLIAGMAAAAILVVVIVVVIVRSVSAAREAERLRVEEEKNAVITTAETQAAMYNYEDAIETLQASEYYEETEEMQEQVQTYQTQEDSLVAWEPEDVTHIFFHTLIVDPSKAFDEDTNAEGYNQYMVTIDEFNKIIDSMYEKGYVMISMHDMCDIDEDGNVTPKEIWLPSDKIPFVLSEDDVSYYHYMDEDGFAKKLIIDDDGKVKNTYVDDDGTVLVGDYDVVPLIDTFVEEHPDFSYHGHKGTIALTGYEGVLGYRTDEVYRTREADRVTNSQQKFFDENPDFDEDAWQNEVDEATKVADAMKAEGWEFASHTWGHIDPLARSFESFELDTDRWEENVEPIVGYTDIIIYAFGADITKEAKPYSDDNEYYQYLLKKGFHIFCDVNSLTYSVSFGDKCMCMGRRDVDGYRMYYNPDRLSDLFDVSEVWDDERPATVAQIE